MLDALRSCGELRRLREENEELCERLAFMEGEAEDRRDRNNVERERHGEEVEGLRGDVSALTVKWMRMDEELGSLQAADACHNIAAVEEKGQGCGFDATPTTPLADERECIKALKDESELTNGRPSPTWAGSGHWWWRPSGILGNYQRMVLRMPHPQRSSAMWQIRRQQAINCYEKESVKWNHP